MIIHSFSFDFQWFLSVDLFMWYNVFFHSWFCISMIICIKCSFIIFFAHLPFQILHTYSSRKLKFESSGKTQRKRADNGLFITLVTKFYNNVFLFVGSTTLGTIIECLLVGQESKRLTTNCNLQIGHFCIPSSAP